MASRKAPSLLRDQSVLWALLAVVVLLSAVIVGVFGAYQTATVTLLHERDQQVAFLSAARLREELTRYGGILTELSHVPAIHQGPAMERRLALAKAHPRLAVFDGGVTILDTFGRVQATTGTDRPVLGADWSRRDFFRAQLVVPGITVSDIHTDGPVNGPTVAISVPMVNAHGEFAGVVAGFFRLGESMVSALYASIVRLRMGQTGTTYLVDGHGNIIYDSDYRPAGGPLDERGPQGLGDLRRAATLRTRDGSGHDVLVAYAPLPGTSWTLIVEDDWDTLTEPVRRYRRYLISLTAAAMLTPLIGLTWLAQRRRRLTPLANPERPGTRGEGVTRALAPPELPMIPGWSLALHVEAGAGDYLDYHFRPDGSVVVVVCRLPHDERRSAHAASVLHAGLRHAALESLSPTAALSAVSNWLGPTGGAAGIPCLWVHIDPWNGQVEAANAGYLGVRHIGPLGIGPLPAGGRPLGEESPGAWAGARLSLHPGDCLIAASLLAEDVRAAEQSSALDTACRMVATGNETAQARLDDLLAAWRSMDGYDALAAAGLMILIIARCGDAGEVPIE